MLYAADFLQILQIIFVLRGWVYKNGRAHILKLFFVETLTFCNIFSIFEFFLEKVIFWAYYIKIYKPVSCSDILILLKSLKYVTIELWPNPLPRCVARKFIPLREKFRPRQCYQLVEHKTLDELSEHDSSICGIQLCWFKLTVGRITLHISLITVLLKYQF